MVLERRTLIWRKALLIAKSEAEEGSELTGAAVVGGELMTTDA